MDSATFGSVPLKALATKFVLAPELKHWHQGSSTKESHGFLVFLQLHAKAIKYSQVQEGLGLDSQAKGTVF